jgi:SecY
MSILALGVVPWFFALTFVELLTVVLPSSWTERFASSGHAQPFSRLVIGLALTIAALQGLGVAEAMTAQLKMVVEPGSAFLVSTVVTLVGGTAFLIALGLLIERHGVGHGFWIMLAASMVAQLQSHIGVMLLVLREGIASPAATLIAVTSIAVIVVLVVAILEARRRADVTEMSILIWPLVLASLTYAFIVDVAVLILPIGSDDKLDALAKMLTNESAGFVIGGVIACLFATRYASREKDWQFFLPVVAVIAVVQLQSIIAEALTVQPPLAGASLIIVTVVAYVVLMRVRELMQGT